jgi:hypothetical protein
MRPRLARHLGAVALAAAFAAGCSSDRREAERAVRDYNEAAILAYRTRDFSRLREVATEREWGKVVVLVDLKTANGLVLESELESLEMSHAAKPSLDHLKVETRERWRYHDRPLQPGRPPGTVFVADMRLEYDFVREDGRWKLDSARTLSNEYLEPKGFRPEAPHGEAQPHGQGQK